MTITHTKAMVATALEQSIIDLAERHNLLSISIDYNRPDDWDHRWFGVSLQWRAANQSRAGVIGSGDNLAECLANAVTAMHAKRGGAETIADEALPELVR